MSQLVVLVTTKSKFSGHLSDLYCIKIKIKVYSIKGSNSHTYRNTFFLTFVKGSRNENSKKIKQNSKGGHFIDSPFI